jgi:DNA-binding transcriptional ArsR family regulator
VAASHALEETFGALADPARLAVIGLLRAKPRRASDVASALSMTRPAMSRHLRILRHAGLVEETAHADDARVRIYQLRPAPFSALRRWLDEVESFWTDQLDSFKTHVEHRYGRRR